MFFYKFFLLSFFFFFFWRHNAFALLTAHFMFCKAGLFQGRLRVMASLVMELCKLGKSWDEVNSSTLDVSMLLS
jgi:hypothetical protein